MTDNRFYLSFSAITPYNPLFTIIRIILTMNENISEDINKSKNTDIKHISAIYLNDSAIEVELLQKQLFRNNRQFSKRKAKDQAFIELATKALNSCIEQAKSTISTKYPTYDDISDFLSK
jgi:hypothetical protein